MTAIPEYVRRLSRTIAEDVANGTFWGNITDEHTHANSRHVGMTSKSMLERMFKDGKPQVSAFNRDRDMRECIVECVLSDLPAICKKNRQKGSRPYSHSVQLADRWFPDSLSVSFPSNNSGAEHCVYIDEISMNMRTYTYTSDNKRVSAPCTVGERPCKRLDLTDEVNMAMFMDQYPDAARYIDKILDRISEERMKIRAERPRRMPNVNIPSGPDLQTDKDFDD